MNFKNPHPFPDVSGPALCSQYYFRLRSQSSLRYGTLKKEVLIYLRCFSIFKERCSKNRGVLPFTNKLFRGEAD